MSKSGKDRRKTNNSGSDMTPPPSSQREAGALERQGCIVCESAEEMHCVVCLSLERVCMWSTSPLAVMMSVMKRCNMKREETVEVLSQLQI